MALRLVLFFAFFPTISVGADWLSITGENAPIALLLDQDSVVPIVGTPKIKAWVRYVHFAKLPKVGAASRNAGKEYYESLNLYHYNCTERMHGLAQQILYSKSGDVLDSSTIQIIEMQDVAPDTLGESGLESACAIHKIKTSSKP